MFDSIKETLGISLADFTLNKLLSAVIVLVICLVVVKILMTIVTRFLGKSSLERSLHTFVRTTIKVVLLFLTVVIVATTLGINVTSLIALLSVFGLAVSLAVQNSMSNVAGGIQVLGSKPFVVGDFVEAGGVSGTVADVGIFYTKIRTGDNKMIQVPNSQIANEKIVNYTVEEERRVDFKFTASYDAPVETVKKVLEDVLNSHPMVQVTPAPFVRVSNYGDSAIEYSVRGWCATDDYWTVYFDVMEQVKVAFDKAGIEMTYPHINVHMMDK